MRWMVVDSPLGELRLVGEDGSLTGVDFLGPMPGGTPARSSVALHASRAARSPGQRDDAEPVLKEAAAQLAAYFSGDLRDFDLAVVPVGTPFQQRVWAQLRAIPYGQTTSYGALAARLDMSGHAARAVGLANGRNPVPIVVPCHRVVAADGRLTGYGGGLERKRLLIELEQRRVA